jgi:hypothetical protein
MIENNFDISVRHIAFQSRWFLNASRYALLNNPNNTEAFGTHRKSAVELIEDSLNQQLPTVRDPHPTEPDRFVVNLPETAAAREKQEQIQKAFAEWAWSDPKRAQMLAQIYNAKFNSRVTRQFDGSHLTLPGSNRNIKLRPSQKNAIWRILQSPTTLLAHAVGGGKTMILIGAAMELKRLKLAKKPLFAVPNHLVDQFAKEFLRLYPNANILVIGRDEIGKDRNVLMAKIATGDWDGVVCSHSSFNRLPVRQETELEFEASQLREIEDALLIEQEGNNDRRIVKTLERAKRKFEVRMDELKERVKRDDSLCFEDLGIDVCSIDEAHIFKNLYYTTKMQVAGLNQSDSGRARDLYLKCRWLLRKHGRGLVFATGTPVANSVAELYTFMRYLAQGILDNHGLSVFDDWAATFGETVTCLELSPEGQKYRVNTRFSRFTNIPEMMSLTATFADIKTHDALDLDRPAIHGGKPEIVIIPPTEALKTFIDQLGQRAEAVRSGSVDPHSDNMLSITTDGRKAALDMRLIHPDMVATDETKASAAAKRIVAIWRETEAERGTQLVFCDLATPSSAGFNVYAEVRIHLLKHGIPESQIAFIHDYSSDSSKLQLYRDVNRGAIRILFGSTEKLGCGTNVQERLAALHHLDSPWRPCDIEQREGRILRQGNRFKQVHILRYVTETSFDSYMWQILESKIRFVTQFMNGDSSVRTAEDVDSAVLSYAEIKALASGNPKILEKAAVDNEVQKLSLLEKAWLNGRYNNQMELHALGEKIKRLQKHQVNVQADLDIRQDTSGDKFTMTIGSQTFTERKAAGFEILRLAQHHVPRLNHNETREIGTIGGFTIQLRKAFFDGKQATIELAGHALYEAELSDSPLGVIASLENQLRRMNEKLASATVAETEATERQSWLQQSLTSGFQHAVKLAQLRKKQATLNEELQVSKGETMEVGDESTGE